MQRYAGICKTADENGEKDMSYNIAVIPCDGHRTEIVREAQKVLDAAGKNMKF